MSSFFFAGTVRQLRLMLELVEIALEDIEMRKYLDSK